jgi:hypothetical protein
VTPPLSTSTPASHRGLTQAGGALAAPQADVRQLHAAPAALASALQHSAAKKVERLPSKSASGPCLCTQTCHTPIPTHTHTSTSPTYHNHTDIHPRITTLTGAPPPPPLQHTHKACLPVRAHAVEQRVGGAGVEVAVGAAQHVGARLAGGGGGRCLPAQHKPHLGLRPGRGKIKQGMKASMPTALVL